MAPPGGLSGRAGAATPGPGSTAGQGQGTTGPPGHPPGPRHGHRHHGHHRILGQEEEDTSLMKS